MKKYIQIMTGADLYNVFPFGEAYLTTFASKGYNPEAVLKRKARDDWRNLDGAKSDLSTFIEVAYGDALKLKDVTG